MISKEIGSLEELECFYFKNTSFEPPSGYQKTTLRMIFNVKQNLRRKALLVTRGHLVDAKHVDIYLSTVKGVSINLLEVISEKNDLQQLCGDVGNAFVNAYTDE